MISCKNKQGCHSLRITPAGFNFLKNSVCLRLLYTKLRLTFFLQNSDYFLFLWNYNFSCIIIFDCFKFFNIVFVIFIVLKTNSSFHFSATTTQINNLLIFYEIELQLIQDSFWWLVLFVFCFREWHPRIK